MKASATHVKGSPLSGERTISRVRQHQHETLLSFSCGKDAIAAWIAIRPHFDRVVPFFLYIVPRLSFVDEALDYYERYFGEKIYRLPHPSLYRMLNNFTFQPPERCAVIEAANLPNFNYEDVRAEVADAAGVQDDVLYATGVRAADSPMRRTAINQYGPITWSQRKYHPVWDMRKADLLEMFRKHKVKLPIDYAIFGRTFDGIDLRFLLPLKKQRPDDYRKVLDWFPLAELEIFRWEHAHA